METPRSSVSKTVNPNRCSCNARTPVELHGPFSSEDNTRRVSLRYDTTYFAIQSAWTCNKWSYGITRLNKSTNGISQYRKLQRSAPARPSSNKELSSVLPSMSSRREEIRDLKLDPLLVSLRSRPLRRSVPQSKPPRRPQRQRPMFPPSRKSASKVLRARHQSQWILAVKSLVHGCCGVQWEELSCS